MAEPARQYAFVCIIFGSHPQYCLEAAVLGFSLRRTGTAHDMVLLHDNQVPHTWFHLLKWIGWKVVLVDRLECESLYDGSSGGRFAGTFTKLHAISLTEYHKVCILDADTFVRKNIDHLFHRCCPCAFRRHAGADQPDGSRIIGSRLFHPDGTLRGGINAGVMVFRTSK